MAKVIGVTGSFGSGKSTVAKFFEEYGLRVLDADMIAHEVFRSGSQTLKKIGDVFPEAIQLNGEANRKQIADIVFKDHKRLEQLEAIIHPYVFEVISKEIVSAGDKHIVVDMPLLFETGFEKECFKTLVVKAPKEAQARLKKKGFSEADLKARQAAQMSLEEKEKRADFIIDNSKSLEHTKTQIEEIWKKIKP